MAPWMLVVSVVVVLVGVAAMLAIGGRIMEDRLDDRIEAVNKDFDDSLNRFRQEVRREFESRLPPGSGGVGVTPTPFATPTPEPTATPEDDGSATPTPTATPSAEASPTATPDETIVP